MVYITGDVHGDIDFFKDARLKKLTEDDTLIICGDFGFLWEGKKKEKKALSQLEKKKYTICFLDGVHENFDMLNSYPPYRYKGGNAQKIASNIYHLMRGEIFTFERKTFFVMGGGESEDIEMRRESKTYFESEMPSSKELLNGAKNLKDADYEVNYVLTYEAPAIAKDFIRMHTNEEMHFTPLNTYLGELMKSVKYTHWYFGSLHMDMPISKNMTVVFNDIIKV